MKKNALSRRGIAVLSAWLVLFFFAGCDRKDGIQPSGSVQFTFSHVCGDQPLQLNTTEYTNAAGEPFRVQLFKYYISNIRFRRADGSEFVQPESYYLVDEATTSSKTFTIPNVPEGSYTGINFIIGVDSTRNVSGAQTGALDPINGMFWTWNTGYIFVMLEGESPVSTAEGNRLRYHIGGFRNPNNIRTVSPSLNGSRIAVTGGSKAIVNFRVNVAQMFESPNPISFVQTPTLMFDPATALIADNYVDMFSVVSVTQP